ncbi:hypothetical protein L7F22_017352 [Adiantum nelumboides]|nr:hypothetical protein [Adiantum nelumboides]
MAHRLVRSVCSLTLNARRSLLIDLAGGTCKGMQEESSLCHWKQVSLRHFAGRGKKSKRAVASPDETVLGEKHAALEDALAQISSTFGKETVMWLGRNVANRNIPIISTGSLSLDFALGVGGLPKGRVVEIYGPEASGKTTLALHVIAEAQKTGGYCVFIDAEHALDPSFAEALGVRTEDLLLAQPDCGEQALSLTDTFIRSGSIDVIVVDSVAALVPRAELDGDMGDAHMAVQARLMSQALRKLAHSLSKSQTILIFINQIRAKLSHGGFGSPIEVTSGGNALKFYASVRLNIRRTGFIKKGEELVGSSVTVKVAKNKVAPPFKTAEFEIEFGKGISKEGEISDFAVKYSLITKSGNWYAYNGENIANGKENLKRYLREHADLKDLLLTRIRERLVGGPLDEDESSSNDDEPLSEHEYGSSILELEEMEEIAKH